MKRSLSDSFAVNRDATYVAYAMRYYPMRPSYSDGVWLRRDDEKRGNALLLEESRRRGDDGRFRSPLVARPLIIEYDELMRI